MTPDFWASGSAGNFAELRNIRRSRMGDEDDEFGVGGPATWSG